MQAVYFEDFDGESIVVRDVPDPRKPDAGEVVVRVRAAGLNRADLMQARGAYPPPPGYSANIPGLEFAGEIESVGPGVTDFEKGDRVMAITSGEGQAARVVVDARLLMRIPERLSFTEATAIPETFITAHDAVFTQGRLRNGETLLIHAVGSGVGLSALQMAKSRGVSVVGTSRTLEKLDGCREFGLDLGINTADGPVFADSIRAFNGHGVDVVLELVGGDYFAEDVAALAIKGRIIVVGLTAGRRSEIDLGMTLQKRARIVGTTLRNRSTEEKAAATLAFANDFLGPIERGDISPVVDRVFPVTAAEDAYRYLASNASFGKVVLEM